MTEATLSTYRFRITRSDLQAYAGASGDANPIHLDDEIARAIGLPGVIAHGMYTLALAARAVDAWAGRPGTIRSLQAKFTRPVVVGPDGVEVQIVGTLAGQDDDGTVRITLQASVEGAAVLGGARAVVVEPASDSELAVLIGDVHG